MTRWQRLRHRVLMVVSERYRMRLAREQAERHLIACLDATRRSIEAITTTKDGS